MSDVSPSANASFTPDQQQIQGVLAHWLGSPVTRHDAQRLEGGLCYCVVRLRFDCPPYEAVVKMDVGDGQEGLERERQGLEYLHRHVRFPAPRVYDFDISRTRWPFSYLLLERLPGTNLAMARLEPEDRRRVDQELAAVLLDLHSHQRTTFGQVHTEPGPRQWAEVFLPRLMDLRQDMQTRLPPDLLLLLDEALEPAEQVFRNQGEPSLVHGDVWAGNIMVRPSADGWHLSGLVDLPALEFADVEYELGYIEAWQTVTAAFFETYTRDRPLRPGYSLRRLYYALHTYMLHVWLHGPREHSEQLADVLQRIRLAVRKNR